MFVMYVCVSVSIMAKGLSCKSTVHEGNAGGKSTLRRFHYPVNFGPMIEKTDRCKVMHKCPPCMSTGGLKKRYNDLLLRSDHHSRSVQLAASCILHYYSLAGLKTFFLL